MVRNSLVDCCCVAAAAMAMQVCRRSGDTRLIHIPVLDFTPVVQ